MLAGLGRGEASACRREPCCMERSQGDLIHIAEGACRVDHGWHINGIVELDVVARAKGSRASE
eukprot:3373634-Lingulodinium_polyedra.AAC.1